jgi:dihydroflavonol-4-reductase
MKSLVTGSNGFVGSHLVEGLLRKGYQVHCLVRRTSDLRGLRGLPVKLLYGDVTHEESLEQAVRGIQFVYHAAGLIKARNQQAFDRVNLGGTANLLRACWRRAAQLKRFVLVSSQSAGGPSRDGRPVTEDHEPRPVSRYGRSKLKGEEEARKYLGRLPVTIVRPPAIFGPRDRGMLPFFKMVKKGVVFLVRGERYASFVYVKDLVAGTIAAGESERAVGQTYYIAGERGYGWREFAQAAARVAGKPVRIVAVPEVTMELLGGVNSFLAALTRRARMLDWQKARELLQPYWLCSITKARQQLGYGPAYSLEEGLAETIRWYEKEGWI